MEQGIESFCQVILRQDVEGFKKMILEDPSLAKMADSSNHKPIHYAALKNNREMVRVLLENGASPLEGIYPIRDETSAFALGQAMGCEGVNDEIETWLERERGASKDGRRFISAIWKKEYKLAFDILEENPSVINSPDEHGQTALMVAAKVGNIELVRELIDRGADVNAKDPSGRNVLRHALKRRSLDPRIPDGLCIATILVERNAEYDLWVAAALGDERQVKYLLKHGQDLNPNSEDFSKEYVNPLPIASFYGRYEIVKILVEAGEDPDLKFKIDTRHGEVEQFGLPIRYATEMGHFDIVKLLVELGASPETRQYAAGSAVSWANQAPNRKEIADYLFRKGARADLISYLLRDNRAAIAERIYKEPKEIRSLLRDAALTGNYEYVKMLLEDHGEFDDSFWWDVMHQAIRCWRVENSRINNEEFDEGAYADILDLLLKVSDKPNLRGHKFGESLLHWVVANNLTTPFRLKKRMIDVFVGNGADLEIHDRDFGSTPLGWAVMFGQKELAEYLLSKGAMVNNPETEEWSKPLAWAHRNQDEPMIRTIQGF